MLNLNMIKKHFPTILFLIILTTILLALLFKFDLKMERNYKGNVIEVQDFKGCSNCLVLVYSEECPHCKHLIETLNSDKVNFSSKIYLISTSNPSLFYILNILNKYNYSFSGVPILFTIINDTLYILEGYPAKVQDRNGYLLGKDFEERYCKSAGNPIYINGTYAFCKIGDNRFLGNLYSLNYLLNVCEKNKCYVK